MTSSSQQDEFPVSRKTTVRGSRHLAREKVMQILTAIDGGDVDLDVAFRHVFYRQFTFDSKDAPDGTRILHPDEVLELEADVPITWSNDDVEYARRVIGAAVSGKEGSTTLIRKHAQNWEFERIASLDIILMRLAVAELTSCESIPVKVTINEVIELAKRYSTDKSGTFINGILDAIIEDLKSTDSIKKSGRGLKP
ncbi:MAG: transcription antitermination factor NusB [Candidatus Kapabacteria bacterium]|nr:transcription antitermination factor NusB [Candidatus Kapabacteria bacterium]